MIFRAVKRKRSNESIVVPMGRPLHVSPQLLVDMTEEAKVRDMLKDSFTSETFQESLEKKMQATLDSDPNLPPLKARKLKPKTLHRNLVKALPVEVSQPSIQNSRRMEASQDAFNAISLAATWPAVISGPTVDGIEDTEGAIDKDFMFNIDATSLILGKEVVKKVYLALGSKEKLKKLNLSAAITKKKELAYQPRGVHVMATTSASGDLVHTLIKVKDNTAKEITRVVVRIFCHGFHILIPYSYSIFLYTYRFNVTNWNWLLFPPSVTCILWRNIYLISA